MVQIARALLLRRIAALALLNSMTMAVAAPIAAQSWPNRPLTMVIPYAPGGSTDLSRASSRPGLQ